MTDDELPDTPVQRFIERHFITLMLALPVIGLTFQHLFLQ